MQSVLRLLVPLQFIRGLKTVIIVLAFNRPHELQRTLSSLSNQLLTDRPCDLRVHVDGPDSDELVRQSVQVARSFQWRAGNKTISCHKDNRGILGQWLEAWSPVGEDEFALVVEDDVELSPLSVRFLSHLIDEFKDDPLLYGIALQRPQWQLGICERSRWRRLDLLDTKHYPSYIRYPAVGTWGQLLFPRPWRCFLASANKFKDGDEFAEGLVTEEWSSRDRRLFSPVFTRWALATGMLNLYANFGNATAMARSRQPPGVNARSDQKPHTFDLFPNGLAIAGLMGKTADVRTMSSCFDPMDMSPEEQLKVYGCVIIADGGSVSTRQLVCCLSLFRIYTLPSTPVGLPYPRLVISVSAGCFTQSPLQLVAGCTANTLFLAADGQQVMRLLSSDADDLETRTVPFDASVSLVNVFGACSKHRCAYTPGFYPAKTNLD